MTEIDYSGGPLDIATLEVLARRATTHPLVDGWAFEPDALSPRRLELRLDTGQHPETVETVRLDARWFEDGTYSLHYLESRRDGVWQCRWDRHPKPGSPTAHFHPPPNASSPVEQSDIEKSHHLAVLFSILDWVEMRVTSLHES